MQTSENQAVNTEEIGSYRQEVWTMRENVSLRMSRELPAHVQWFARLVHVNRIGLLGLCLCWGCSSPVEPTPLVDYSGHWVGTWSRETCTEVGSFTGGGFCTFASPSPIVVDLAQADQTITGSLTISLGAGAEFGGIPLAGYAVRDRNDHQSLSVAGTMTRSSLTITVANLVWLIQANGQTIGSVSFTMSAPGGSATMSGILHDLHR